MRPCPRWRGLDMATMADATRLELVEMERAGEDVLLDFRVTAEAVSRG